MPQDTKDQTAPKTMLSFAPAPAPIFTANWDHHRPAVSSPLSSSPLRASSPPGTQDGGAGIFSMRQTQSSPIPAPRFKYASRPTRPNPVLRRREDAQEQRRSNFLRSVRDKAEDKAWQRRDIEGQVSSPTSAAQRPPSNERCSFSRPTLLPTWTGCRTTRPKSPRRI